MRLVAPDGTPEISISGLTLAPSEVNFAGISPPSGKSGQVIFIAGVGSALVMIGKRQARRIVSGFIAPAKIKAASAGCRPGALDPASGTVFAEK